MNTILPRCFRDLKTNAPLMLAGVFLAFAVSAQPTPSVQTAHTFGAGGPGFVKLLQASDGNLYGTTFSEGTYSNGTVFQYPIGGSALTIYSFTGGSDGSNPEGNLAQAPDGNLYGTARYGGASSNGTAFRISTTGTLTTIYTFTGGADGGTPRSGLLLASDGYFYGTTINGGTLTNGTVFRMTTNGTLKTIYTFTGGNDGANPHSALIQGQDGGLYGTTFAGGSSGDGTVYRVTTNGAFSLLHSFAGGGDGATPDANLLQASDGMLYGTTTGGGANGYGVVFQMTTNGSTLTNLYSFTGQDDGASPLSGLTQGSDGNLYGATYYDGANGDGTLFEITTAGAFTTLYAFTGGADGSEPFSDFLLASDNNLYGTTFIGGGTGSGALFSIDTNGTFTALYSFVGNGDGSNPDCNLIQATDGNLYGTALNGGTSGAGTVFRMSTNGTQTTIYSFIGGVLTGNPMSGVVQAPDGSLYGTGSVGAGAIYRVTTNGTFSVPYFFSGNFDGGGPNALVLGNDGNLYGTTYGGGGTNSTGTIFEYPLPSGPLAVLYTFNGAADGGNSTAGLIQASDGNFYGTTSDFSLSSFGTIFRITPAGTFTTIYAFTNGIDGNSPLGPMMQASDGNLYGTASDYGTGDPGTVYRVTTNGVFTELYSFSGGNDGYEPYAGLVQGTDGNLYGTTWGGGVYSGGTIFSITTNGAFTSLYSFTGGDDGSNPGANLMQASDGNLYGTAYYNGEFSQGTVFRVVLSQPVVGPVTLLSPFLSAGQLNFSFQTLSGQSYTIQQTTNLAPAHWTSFSNFTGAGSLFQLAVPAVKGNEFFRVLEP